MLDHVVFPLEGKLKTHIPSGRILLYKVESHPSDSQVQDSDIILCLFRKAEI